MNTNKLVQTLKNEGQDFEFYPTTQEMFKACFDRLFRKNDDYQSYCSWENKFYSGKRSFFSTMENQKMDKLKVLDIGAGNGAFKKAFEEYIEENRIETFKGAHFLAIEKSRILIEHLMDSGYSIIGTDFDEATLIDKTADIVFCNPPYSVYENWVCRILGEISSDCIFLVIPERWKENKQITKLMKETRAEVSILWNGDFLDAERAARAKVEVLFIRRNLKKNECFDRWFNETFQPAQEMTAESESAKQERLGNEMVQAENQIEYLVNSYNGELQKLIENYRKICSLESDLLEEIGLKKEQVKKSVIEKINCLKKIYWNTVFNKLEPITERLTYDTRYNMNSRFVEKQSVDFTAGNVYALLIWVCKNASAYYDKQITEFYLKLSSDENVIPYKSNQRVFQKEEHSWNKYCKHRNEKSDPFILDYRIITRHSVFSHYRTDSRFGHIHDLAAIARTMGFTIGEFTDNNRNGVKEIIYDGAGKVFCEYKTYQNGNTHLKLNREFVTALNVYVGTKLGWIKNKSDIAENFPEEVVPMAEKYFGYTVAISASNIKLLNWEA